MKEIIATTAAPAAIGPYSQGVRVGAFSFYSGQIPLDPATGVLVTGEMASQVRQVLANMEAVLRAAGLGFDQVVQATIYLIDLADFALVNDMYGRCFPQARAVVQVAALPKGARIEIAWIACHPA
jgi:2-iminobutanoate/2-iminopropanoate deaminase